MNIRILSLTTVLAGVLALPALAQTTNPDINRLLKGADEEVGRSKQFMGGLREKDQTLRQNCWQGDHNSCVQLKQMLSNPNLTVDSVPSPPPAGAYWPFNPITGQLQRQ
jgi:hypothetical protein